MRLNRGNRPGAAWIHASIVLVLLPLLALRPSFAEVYRTTVTDVDEALGMFVGMCPNVVGDRAMGTIVLDPADFEWASYKEGFVAEAVRAWTGALRAAPIKKLFKNADGSKLEGTFTACTVVQFSILKNGDVDALEVKDSAGPLPFHDVALGSVKKMHVSALPKDFPRDHAVARIQFLVKADSPGDFRSKLWDGAYTFIYSSTIQERRP